ncbi:glutathione S-transferase family protein [Congregibacter sp.]|uniref:glutathione S-transferase family protein n=1 Tax=Congregibacter sp. TaxID=2744308 RepID=UPI00385A2561
MTDLTLYHADYSTCSQKVRLALAEKKLPYASNAISFRKEEQLSESYLKINPNGVVPTLIHAGNTIVDSSCILEYLDEAFPEIPLSPSTPVERAAMRSWLRFMEEVPTKAIRIPSFEQIFLPTLRVLKSAKSFDKSTDKRTIRRGFYGKMNRGKGFEESEITDSTYELRTTVMRIDGALEGSPWILGKDLSLVDISLAPLIDRAQDMGMTYLWEDLPKVEDWLARIQARPSFIDAFYPGSRLSQRLEFKIAVRSARKRNQCTPLAAQLTAS